MSHSQNADAIAERADSRGPRVWPFYSARARAQVAELVAKGAVLTSGVHPAIADLEGRFAELHGSDRYALFCGSGSSALLSAYFGLDLDPGAEVLVPTNTYPTTVTPLLLLNLRPVLCDSDADTANIDLRDAARRVTARTQAIAVTHMWGHPVDSTALKSFANRHGLAVVEDCSHSHGATCRGESVGRFGDVSAFSLGGRKLVTGGMGGMLLARDRCVFDRALVLGQGAVRAKQQVADALQDYAGAGFGLNLRGNATAAVLARDHLDRLPMTIRVKNRNLDLLVDALREAAPWLVPPQRKDWFTSGTWYGFRCRMNLPQARAEAVVASLGERGVPLSRLSLLLHRQRLFTDPSPMRTHAFAADPLCDPEDYPVSDSAAARSVAIGTERLYEPADDLIATWRRHFEAVTDELQLAA